MVFGPGAETVDWKWGLNGAFFVRRWGLCGAIPRLKDWGPSDMVRFDGHLGRAVALT